MFYGDLMSPATMKHPQAFMESVQIFLSNFDRIRQIFVKVPYIKFHGNTTSGSRFDT